MKPITSFYITISQVGDQCLAEISRRAKSGDDVRIGPFVIAVASDVSVGEPGPIVTTALLSGHLSANAAMTEEGARYFAIKNFCLEISDELRAVLERMEIAL